MEIQVDNSNSSINLEEESLESKIIDEAKTKTKKKKPKL